jgi:dihydroorotate dehydrogenase
MFRLEEDGAVINRYGFPSQGATAVLAHLRSRIPSFRSPTDRAALRDGAILAVNLGKNKESPADSIDDFVSGVRTFGPYSDVLVVNVSSPNTPGLRWVYTVCDFGMYIIYLTLIEAYRIRKCSKSCCPA